MEKIVHQGRNIKRIREILGMKQEALAIELGGNWNQKKVSQLESKGIVEAEILDQVAVALGVNVEAVNDFDEDSTVGIFGRSIFDSRNRVIAPAEICQCSFNPLDKIIELYERMLKEKQEIIDKLANGSE